jgi:hypothetical protein
MYSKRKDVLVSGLIWYLAGLIVGYLLLIVWALLG